MSPLAVTLLALAIAGAIAAGVVLFGRQREIDPARPWWANPGVWIGVSAVFVLLGVFVFPKLFGFTFLFLPFLWIGGSRRRRSDRPQPRDDTGLER